METTKLIHCYVYLTTNLVNDHRYVGQSTKTGSAWNRYLGSGKYFQHALQKYGTLSFKKEILFEGFLTKQDLNDLETQYIAKICPEYNIATKGGGGNLGDECNRRISEAMRHRLQDPIFAAEHSERSRNRWIGVSSQTRASYASKGWVKKSPEARKRLQEKIQGKIDQSQKAAAVSSSWKTNKNLRCDNISHGCSHSLFRGKPIICIETSRIYPSVTFAAKELKVDVSCVKRAVLNSSHTTKGLHFQFYSLQAPA